MATNLSSRQGSQPLNGAAPIAGASQELVDVLQKIVRNAGALLDVDNCSVALLDAGGSSLVTLAVLQNRGGDRGLLLSRQTKASPTALPTPPNPHFITN